MTPVGAPGIVRGVTEDDAVELAELPAAFIATTAKVYAVPFVNPVKVQVRALTLVQPAGGVTAGDDVTE